MPSSARSASSSRSSATESAPPLTATATRSPGRNMCRQRDNSFSLNFIKLLLHPQVIATRPHLFKIAFKCADLPRIIAEARVVILRLLAGPRPVGAAVAQQARIHRVRLQVHQIAPRRCFHPHLDVAFAAKFIAAGLVAVVLGVALLLLVLLAIAIDSY